jgi:hypothetical protein
MRIWPQKICSCSFFPTILSSSINFFDFWCRNHFNSTYPPFPKTTKYFINFFSGLIFFINSNFRIIPRMKCRSLRMRPLN